jgi:pimeloyl-ACP methyl ester carboxylesterase
MRQPRPFSLGDAAAGALVGAADRVRLAALKLAGVRSHRILTRAGRIHVLDVEGRGALPPVVLLHGLSSTAADFRHLFRRLAPYCRRIIAPDLPGHGESDPPPLRLTAPQVLDAITDALDQVLDRPSTIFGNSLGGAAAIRYATSGSPFAGSLFLVSPAGGHGAPEETAGVLQLLRADTHATAREFMRRVLPSKPLALSLLAWGARARLRRLPVRDLIERTSPEDLLHPSDLGELTMPITLVWGGRENLLPASHERFFRAALPSHAEFLRPPTFGHAPFIDHPDEVSTMLCQFAADVATSRTLQPSSSTATAGI